jgi:hypothetical protein
MGWKMLSPPGRVSSKGGLPEFYLKLAGNIDLATCELLPRKIVVPMRHVQLQQRGFVQSREVRAGQALTVGCVDVHVAIMSQRVPTLTGQRAVSSSHLTVNCRPDPPGCHRMYVKPAAYLGLGDVTSLRQPAE